MWVTQMNHIPMEIDSEKHRDWLSSQVTWEGEKTPDSAPNQSQIYFKSGWVTTIPGYMDSVHDLSHKNVLPRASNAELRHGSPYSVN